MNCGRRECAYQCVQSDEKMEHEKTNRIIAVSYAIRDFADPKIDANTRRKALDMLEKILKKEEMI